MKDYATRTHRLVVGLAAQIVAELGHLPVVKVEPLAARLVLQVARVVTVERGRALHHQQEQQKKNDTVALPPITNHRSQAGMYFP